MIFDFIKKAGKNLTDGVADRLSTVGDIVGIGDANASEAILEQVKQYNLGIDGLEAEIDGEKVILTGTAKNAADAEKAVLVAGNIEGVSQVESRITVENSSEKSEFYVVQSGDNLSKISKQFYGDANKYHTIFEANKPMLSDPDKIYPGQTLRIPAQEQSQAA